MVRAQEGWWGDAMEKPSFPPVFESCMQSEVSQEGDVRFNTDTRELAARQPQNKSKEVVIIRRTSSLNQV